MSTNKQAQGQPPSPVEQIIDRCEFAKQHGTRPARVVLAKVGGKFHTWVEYEQEGKNSETWERVGDRSGVSGNVIRREFARQVAERIAGYSADDLSLVVDQFLPAAPAPR